MHTVPLTGHDVTLFMFSCIPYSFLYYLVNIRLWGQWWCCIRGVRSWIWQREWRRVSPYLLPHQPDPLPALWDRKPVLRFFVRSADYSAIQSPQYEDLLEVVTRTVAKLNIDWPTEKQTEPQRSKLDERFLHTKSLPPRQSLPFFSRSPHRDVEILEKTILGPLIHPHLWL